MRCTALEMVAVVRIAKRARRGDTNADLDSLAETMDARYGAAQVRPKRQASDVVDLPENARKADIPRVS